MGNFFKEAAERIYHEARCSRRLVEGRTRQELKEIALRQDGVIQTSLGSIAVDSEPMSRSAPHTKNSVDDPFGEEEEGLAFEAVERLGRERIISLDTVVGDGRDGVTARFLMPEPLAHIAYGLHLLFEKAAEPRIVENPVYTVIFFTDEAFERNRNKKLDDKDVAVRLWMGTRRGEQVKICRNTTYLGEAKKGIFQFESWRAKVIDKQGIFLHCGARRDRFWIYDRETERPELKTVVTGVAGLTATGKTTTLCRTLAKLPKEASEAIGDDGGILDFNGGYAAFEQGGLYVKTEGLDENQPEILRAVLAPEAFLENIAISRYPYIPDFIDTSKTGNGRAVILRQNLEVASAGLRADKLQAIILLTRNPLVNVVSKLSPEQATMQFIYGESIESSGGNPAEAGKFKRVFFLDPFVTGNRLEHALLFHEIIRKNQIRCYLANTGTIGENDQKVTLRHSLSAYSDILRSQIRFRTEPDHLGYRGVMKCDRADLDCMNALPLYNDKSVLKKRVLDFLRGRQAYIEAFESEWGRIPADIKESLPSRPESVRNG